MIKGAVRYFYTNPIEHYVLYYGLPFSRFYACYKDDINGALLIKHQNKKAALHRLSGFDYITKANLQTLSDKNIGRYGDFCWTDFEDEESLDLLSRHDVAELLYFGHTSAPLDTPFLGCLGNKLAYWSHNDRRYCKVYFRDMNDAVPLLSAAMEQMLGYPKKGAHISFHTLGEYLLSLSEKGLLMNADMKTKASGLLTLPIYIAGMNKDISHILNNKRAYFSESKHFYDLRYDTKLDMLKLESAASLSGQRE